MPKQFKQSKHKEQKSKARQRVIAKAKMIARAEIASRKQAQEIRGAQTPTQIRGVISPMTTSRSEPAPAQTELSDEYPDPIFAVPETPRPADEDFTNSPRPPIVGQEVVTVNPRSYTPPVSDAPGGGGAIEYELYPGIYGYAKLMNDGTVWIFSPEPSSEVGLQQYEDDWTVIEKFLGVLHRRCRIVNVIWGELPPMLVKLGWINRPRKVESLETGTKTEVDVWYPPELDAAGNVKPGYVEGGFGETSHSPVDHYDIENPGR